MFIAAKLFIILYHFRSNECFSAMEKWKKTSFTVAIYMFLTEVRPLEPYLTAYQTGPNGNISLFEVVNKVELIKSIAALFGSLLMLITADYFLYKPNIIFLTMCSCLSYFLLIGYPSLLKMKVAAAGMGAMYSVNMVAFSYMYSQIEDKHQFQVASSIVSTAVLLGKVVGDFSAEVIVYIAKGSYSALPYCNVFCMFLAVIWACLFLTAVQKNSFLNENVPNEKSQLLKHDDKKPQDNCEKTLDNAMLCSQCRIGISMLREVWTVYKTSYSNKIVSKSSLWYVFGMAAYCGVLANVNVLYSYVVKIPGNHDTLSNGFSEALVTLFGAVGAYMIGKVQLDWNFYCDTFTTLCSISMGVFIMSFYFCHHLYLIYIFYILFSLVWQAHLVIIVSEIAKPLKRQYYSLVLVLNYLLASIISTIMMTCFTLFNFVTIPGRFMFIGSLYILLGIIFLFISLCKGSKIKCFY